MCGISGLFCIEGDGIGGGETGALRDLMTAGTVRGYDGSGMFFMDAAGERTLWHIKDATTGGDIIDKNSTQLKGARFAVQHNRAATIGGVTKETTHPFCFENVTGVHNGTFRTWRNMWKDSKQKVDSAALFEELNNTGETQGEILNVLETLGAGAYALVWHDSRTNMLHFARNDQRPLHIITSPSGVWFASERRMLEWVLSRNHEAMLYGFELAVETLISINVSTGVLTHKAYTHNAVSYSYTDSYITSPGYWSTGGNWDKTWQERQDKAKRYVDMTDDEFRKELSDSYDDYTTAQAYEDDDADIIDPWELLKANGEVQ